MKSVSQIEAKMRQQKVIRGIQEGKSRRQAMRDAGYSDSYSNSSFMNGTKVWAELVEEIVDDKTLLDKWKQLMEAKKAITIKGLQVGEQPDNDVQLRALDMGFKLKGKYAPEKLQITNPYDDMTQEELDAEIAKLEAMLNVQNYGKKKTKKTNK
jgi:hypothetical protein